MIACRRAAKNDVALFKDVRLRALKDSPEAYGSTYEAALQRDHDSWQEQLWSTTTGDLRNTQFAFEGEDCIGIAALYRAPNAPSGDIIMMWVDPRCRGTKAASMLVEKLLCWAKDSGFSAVSLNVTDTNTRAIRFYENQGFHDTGEKVEVDLNRNLHGIRMTRELG